MVLLFERTASRIVIKAFVRRNDDGNKGAAWCLKMSGYDDQGDTYKYHIMLTVIFEIDKCYGAEDDAVTMIMMIMVL